MVDELRKRGIEVIDSLLNSTSATRAAASALSEVLRWLAEAHTTSRLSKAYQAWRKTMPLNSEEKPVLERAARQLGSIRRVEDFVAPMPGSDWLENSGLADSDPAVFEQLSRFRELARRWQAAAVLPVDQLVLTLAQDFFTEPADLAVAHKMASLIRQRSDAHPDWQIDLLSDEVTQIAKNERRFLGFSEDDFELRSRALPGQGRRRHHSQGQGAGMGSRLPAFGQQLRLPLRRAVRPVHRREVVHPRQPEPGSRGPGPAQSRPVHRGVRLLRGRPGHARQPRRLCPRAPAPVLRRPDARQTRAGDHLEHRAGRQANPSAARFRN